MKRTELRTTNLILRLRSPDEVRAEIEALDPAVKKEVSPDWLRRVGEATDADPWLHGFALVHRATGTVVGSAAFKAPPGADGTVEIAYRVAPEHQGHGFATEAAEALRDFAFDSGAVRVVRGHTRPEQNASTRVLTKCGFRFVGGAIDPDDGLVWRWESSPEPADG